MRFICRRKMQKCNISIREKLGQLIMMDFRYWKCDKKGQFIPMTEVSPEILTLIKQYRLGSVILFRENIQNTAQTVSLLRKLQSASEFPLFFGVDQEGGIVNRLQQGTTTPGNMLLGATGDTQCAEDMADVIGSELSVLGFNLNFAPTLDINSNQNNPIIGIRSFSDDTETVWAMGKAYIKGLQQQNIIPCVKHFPGHGDTEQDTHVDLATIKRREEELYQQELYPFVQACDAQVEMVMAAHVTVPALDNTTHVSKKDGRNVGMPASLSYEMLTNLLRKKMDYQGLLVTDALDMHAISLHFGQIEATIKCILAGADMAMMPIRVWEEEDIPAFAKLFDGLEKEYLDNEKFASRVEESYQRIISFKQHKKLLENPVFTLDEREHVAKAEGVVSSQSHYQRELAVARKGVTLLKNDGLLPFKLQARQQILILDTCDIRLDLAENLLQKISKNCQLIIDIQTRKIVDQEVLSEDLKKAIAEADLTLLLSENLQSFKTLTDVITQFAKECSCALVNIACNRPYDIAYLPLAQNYLCVYGASSFDQTNKKISKLEVNLLSGFESLFLNGEGNMLNNPQGKLPVTIRHGQTKVVLFARGSGLSYQKQNFNRRVG